MLERCVIRMVRNMRVSLKINLGTEWGSNFGVMVLPMMVNGKGIRGMEPELKLLILIVVSNILESGKMIKKMEWELRLIRCNHIKVIGKMIRSTVKD